MKIDELPEDILISIMLMANCSLRLNKYLTNVCDNEYFQRNLFLQKLNFFNYYNPSNWLQESSDDSISISSSSFSWTSDTESFLSFISNDWGESSGYDNETLYLSDLLKDSEKFKSLSSHRIIAFGSDINNKLVWTKILLLEILLGRTEFLEFYLSKNDGDQLEFALKIALYLEQVKIVEFLKSHMNTLRNEH